MRTTITLESDVEKLVREAMTRGRKSFKRVVNEAVRRGLGGGTGESEGEFVVAARRLGVRAGIDPARLAEIDDDLEVEEFLRKSRALEKARSR